MCRNKPNIPIMKSFLTTFLALALLACIARADNILIYQGYSVQRVNSGPIAVTHYFWLFDMTTLQANNVAYGVTNGTKFDTVGTPVSFVYDPVAAPQMTSETNFEIGSSQMSPPFALNFAEFYGVNVAHNLGGTYVSQFPEVMSYNNYSITGSGTTETDSATTDRGLFSLSIVLTRTSNSSNDDLAAATTIVTTFLSTLGYPGQL
jgi:hypothetical protein